MTDPIDDLLTRDGAYWRAGQGPPASVDPSLLRRRSRRWQPAAAAAAVLLLTGAAAGTAVAMRRPPSGIEAGSPAATTSTGNPELDKWLVRDGDRVVIGSADVIASPGRPVRACYALSVSQPALTVTCAAGLPLSGVDLDHLTDRRSSDGTVQGMARLDGVYRNGTVFVDRQGAPAPEGPSLDDTARCPVPAGGWRRPAAAEATAAAAVLTRYATARPEQYLVPSAGILPKAPGDDAGPPVPVILTTLDPATARARLQAQYGGNDVCVYRVPNSRSDLTAAAARARAADPGQRLGGFTDEISGYYDLQPPVVDPATLAALARIDAGQDVVRVTPLVRPAR